MGSRAGSEFSQARRCGRVAAAVWLITAALACSDVSPTRADSSDAAAVVARPAATTRVVVAGETFEVEVAADPRSRYRGLSGRGVIPDNGGMLFVLTRPEPMSMVMRDCSHAIDVAFIDAMGRVVAIHEMPPEPPRRSAESPFQYEQRLPEYRSGAPVSFALETAGGRLAELNLEVGARLHFPAQQLIKTAQSNTPTPD
jgi:uncharacterized membrane protein (UPF0127 family)